MAHVRTRTVELPSFATASRLLIGAALLLAFVMGTAHQARAERPRSADGIERPSAPKAPSTKVEKTSFRTKRAYLGRAPYICSPSGFGRTASCFLRAGAE